MHASPLCSEALCYSRIRQEDRALVIHENTLCLNTAQRLERDFKTLLFIARREGDFKNNLVALVWGCLFLMEGESSFLYLLRISLCRPRDTHITLFCGGRVLPTVFCSSVSREAALQMLQITLPWGNFHLFELGILAISEK